VTGGSDPAIAQDLREDEGMSNFRSLSGQANPRVPTPPRGETIARYETYLDAQRAVDYLSDQQFPVQFVTIVGTGLRMVERVTGRLTYPRVAGASALSGLYFGFFVGLALSLFGGGNDLSVLAVALVGAGFGMMFGIISYAMTRGRRDFTSTSQIVASEYEVLCLTEQANEAREILGRLPGTQGRGQVVSHPFTASGQQDQRGQKGQQPTQNPYAAPGQTSAGGQRPTAPFPPPTGTPSSYGPPPESPPSMSQQPAEPSPAELVGPTYGEMMERQRQEQRARLAAERDAAARDAAARDAAARDAAARDAAARDADQQHPERGTGNPSEDEPGDPDRPGRP
jgi:hypothetical protein